MQQWFAGTFFAFAAGRFERWSGSFHPVAFQSSSGADKSHRPPGQTVASKFQSSRVYRTVTIGPKARAKHAIEAAKPLTVPRTDLEWTALARRMAFEGNEMAWKVIWWECEVDAGLL